MLQDLAFAVGEVDVSVRYFAAETRSGLRESPRLQHFIELSLSIRRRRIGERQFLWRLSEIEIRSNRQDTVDLPQFHAILTSIG